MNEFAEAVAEMKRVFWEEVAILLTPTLDLLLRLVKRLKRGDPE